MQLNGFVLRKERYSTREVAEIFQVSVQLVRSWCATGLLTADQIAPKAKNAKHDKWRWVVYSNGLHDLEVNKQSLIQASMKYWPKLMQEVRNTSPLRRSRKGLATSQGVIAPSLQGEAS